MTKCLRVHALAVDEGKAEHTDVQLTWMIFLLSAVRLVECGASLHAYFCHGHCVAPQAG